MRHGRLTASRDTREVGVGSRLTADRVATFYQRNLHRFARGHLVDLGCGKVPLYGAYRAFVDSVTCVDWPQSAHLTAHLDHQVDLGGPLPFGDATFQTVLLSDVLEHVPTPELLWAEIARVLAPGGHVLMNIPFLYGIHESPHDYGRYTEFALRRFVQRAGLTIIELNPVGGSQHVLADVLAKHLSHIPWIGTLAATAIQALIAALDRTDFGNRLMQKTAVNFPLGYFMVAARPDSNFYLSTSEYSL